MPRTIDFSWKHGPLSRNAQGSFEVAGTVVTEGGPLRLFGALGRAERNRVGAWVWRKDGHAEDGTLLSGRIGEPAAVPERDR